MSFSLLPSKVTFVLVTLAAPRVVMAILVAFDDRHQLLRLKRPKTNAQKRTGPLLCIFHDTCITTCHRLISRLHEISQTMIALPGSGLCDDIIGINASQVYYR